MKIGLMSTHFLVSKYLGNFIYTAEANNRRGFEHIRKKEKNSVLYSLFHFPQFLEKYLLSRRLMGLLHHIISQWQEHVKRIIRL